MQEESTDQTPPTLENRLVAKYGELIELQELVQLLKYPSPLALKRAVASGKLNIELVQIGSRKVAATRDVATLLVTSGLSERPGSTH